MSKMAPHGETDRAPEITDNLEQQEDEMEGEGQASAPGQTPRPVTGPGPADGI